MANVTHTSIITARKEGDVFYTCLSFCSQDGVSATPPRQTPLGRHPHPPGQTPRPMHAGIHCPVHAGIHPPAQCMLGYGQ